VRPGRFIVLEGGEGSGKSTVAAAIARRLRERGVSVVETREPGGTPLGEGVRVLLRDEVDPWAEAFLVFAARAELVASVIRPSLAQGVWVVCDRYSPSTLAYQGYGRGLDVQALRLIDAVATARTEPDLVVLLDIDPERGLARKAGETGAAQTGREGLDFHRRVREGYLALLRDAPPGTWVRIDASRDLAAVQQEAWSAVAALLP